MSEKKIRAGVLPRPFVLGLAVRVLASLTFATHARLTDRPLSSQVPASAIAAERAVLLVSNLTTGDVTVTSTEGETIAQFGQDGGGFISTIHRVILRERGKRSDALDGPIFIRAFENGRLGLHDPITGLDTDLMAFGDSNVEAFASLLSNMQPEGGRTDGTADERS